jgi:S-(hydroxymethyl)glutathione dehydrogenase / alcohol dehydrogenase
MTLTDPPGANAAGQAVMAAVLERPGDVLRVEELLLDAPGPGEVRVRTLASGVCHSDLHLVEGEWGDTPPIVLGHEGCGVVEETGPGVTEPQPGQAVVLDWFASCGTCDDCRTGRPWTCRRTRATENVLPDGSTRLHRPDGSPVLSYLHLGTFATATVVPAASAVPIPDSVPPEVAALIGCCVTTGLSSVLRAANPPPGSPAVVFGLGGVGLSVVMGLALAGAAPIVAVDRVREKLELASTVGATDTVTATDAEATVDAVREATGGGAMFSFEAIGLRATIEQAIRSLRAGGTAVIVGMTPFGVRASFDAFDIVDRSLAIVGTNYGFGVPREDFPRYASLYLEGTLPIDRLIDDRITLEHVNEAFNAMRRGEGARRIIVFPRPKDRP